MVQEISGTSGASLLTLDGVVYAPNKQQRSLKTYGAQHQEERITYAGAVAEEEGCLQDAPHI